MFSTLALPSVYQARVDAYRHDKAFTPGHAYWVDIFHFNWIPEAALDLTVAILKTNEADALAHAGLPVRIEKCQARNTSTASTVGKRSKSLDSDEIANLATYDSYLTRARPSARSVKSECSPIGVKSISSAMHPDRGKASAWLHDRHCSTDPPLNTNALQRRLLDKYKHSPCANLSDHWLARSSTAFKATEVNEQR